MAYFKHIFLLAFFMLIQSKEIKNQNQQLFIEYDFYYYQYVGEYKIESLTGTNSNLQTIVRNFNLQTSPGIVENITEKNFCTKI
ncbi:hypothetical protein MWU59_00140 [Flavobacteriaceae bacterium F08102]|nr:hypothetical protein [Flavobacteriaceae bacterium F08102]